jgi:hypothetical protein
MSKRQDHSLENEANQVCAEKKTHSKDSQSKLALFRVFARCCSVLSLSLAQKNA